VLQKRDGFKSKGRETPGIAGACCRVAIAVASRLRSSFFPLGASEDRTSYRERLARPGGWSAARKSRLDYRGASDATHSISISIFGFGSAWTTQVVRAG
jgi:hypothetical protein